MSDGVNLYTKSHLLIEDIYTVLNLPNPQCMASFYRRFGLIRKLKIGTFGIIQIVINIYILFDYIYTN